MAAKLPVWISINRSSRTISITNLPTATSNRSPGRAYHCFNDACSGFSFSKPIPDIVNPIPFVTHLELFQDSQQVDQSVFQASVLLIYRLLSAKKRKVRITGWKHYRMSNLLTEGSRISETNIERGAIVIKPEIAREQQRVLVPSQRAPLKNHPILQCFHC